ncbi:Y-family DNA polymerase [Rhodocytophaga aerolata]|uniref:Y-family DNA polymerase n=1 Tax=Rhodocytophaga aerolata TaxID=455078 RepID=A0ABT8R2C3_9BACT|nr:Y-family DNA polymerase [Rhodocytophaga aerolata]MDO1445509.1 Y-family DNA polymerase [Rhodocytophaga aerolata]
MFALCDCNNFYANCERVFNPSLNNKPVIVLSNNDGSIIARSNEAKALGIQMGQPYFQARKVIEEHKVAVFSSNYELYGDMSNRVMTVLSGLAPETEIYSIDECFLGFPGWQEAELLTYAQDIKEKVKNWTGIPVSIGLAPTKTLAKAANKVAKKSEKVCLIRESSDIDSLLENLPIEELWGIGRQYAKLLKANSIHTALQFKNMPDGWIHKHLTIMGLRLAYELRGVSCLPLEKVQQTKKAICTSRSFGHYVSTYTEMEEAVSSFVFKCSEKLRKEGTAASVVTVFIHTNTFNTTLPQYSNSQTLRLPVATDSTPELIHYVLKGLKAIYKPGYAYKKAGVIVTGIVPNHAIQQNLFDEVDRAKHTQLMTTIDQINKRLRKHTDKFQSPVKFAVQTHSTKEANWPMQRKYLSPCYTTRWDQVLKAS